MERKPKKIETTYWVELIAEWKERETKLKLLTEWDYFHNGNNKEGKKESKNHIYLDTSPATAPKHDDH